MKKELKRSADDRIIFGVCGGIGEYFGIDSNVVRLVWAGISLFAGTGVVLYLIAAFILPKGDPGDRDLKDVVRPNGKPETQRSDGAGYREPQEKDLKDVIRPKQTDAPKE